MNLQANTSQFISMFSNFYQLDIHNIYFTLQ